MLRFEAVVGVCVLRDYTVKLLRKKKGKENKGKNNHYYFNDRWLATGKTSGLPISQLYVKTKKQKNKQEQKKESNDNYY